MPRERSIPVIGRGWPDILQGHNEFAALIYTVPFEYALDHVARDPEDWC